MDIAGLVKVRVQADLSELDSGLALGEQKANAFDRKVSGSFNQVGRSAKDMGQSINGAAARAAIANDNIAGSARRAALGMDGLVGAAQRAVAALGAILGSLVVAAFSRYADAWSDMQSRVGAAIKDMDAAPAMMQRIVDIANASYSPLDQTVEIYSRNVSVLRDLGKGATEAADFTEALNHALVLTATRGERAASVQNALSKAMAVGKLQAEGLETILANGGEVAQALADELGTSVNGLRKFASEGKITGSVIAEALIKRLDDLRERASEMPATIGDAFTRIQTNLTAFIGQMDKASGASEALAGYLLSLADNIGRVVTYGATAVTMYGTYYVAALVAAYVSTMTLSGALALLRVALIRTGLGALVVAAGELVYQFTRLVGAAGGFGNAMALLGDVASEVWGRIKLDASSLVLALQATWKRIEVAWLTVLSAMQKGWAEFLYSVADGLDGLPGLASAAMSVRESAMMAGTEYLETQRAIEAARKEVERLGAASEEAAQKARAPLESIAAIKKVLEGTGTGDIPNGSRPSPTPDVDKAAEKQAKAYDRITQSAHEFIASQSVERQALGMTEEEANRLRYEHDLLNDATRAGINLDSKASDGIRTKREELVGLAAQMAAAEQATNSARMAQEAWNDAGKSFGGILKGLLDGTTSWKDALLQTIPVVLKLLNTMNIAQGGKGLFGGGFFQSLLGGLLGIGFADGGFTGAGAASQPAGFVHAGEYVFSKPAVDRLGIGYLDSLHGLARGYRDGGIVERVYSAANSNLRGFAPGGYVPVAASGGGAAVATEPARLDVYVHAEEGKMFRPVIRAESQGVAVKVVQAAAPGIVQGSVSATQGAARNRPGFFR